MNRPKTKMIDRKQLAISVGIAGGIVVAIFLFIALTVVAPWVIGVVFGIGVFAALVACVYNALDS